MNVFEHFQSDLYIEVCCCSYYNKTVDKIQQLFELKGGISLIYNQKVDFHSHFLSKTYYEYLAEYEGSKPDDFPTPKWSAEGHIKLMDKLGIAFAFLSVSSPNLSKAEKEKEISLVHKVNDEGAQIVSGHTDRFGLFASLPLPHEDAAIKEARYALETLKADGFGLSTHYAGVYLGDKRYDRLMAYLDSVGAVIAVHPVKPAGLPNGVNSELPIPAMEFFMDTTRTFTNMVMNNIFLRFPNIKWIFPHAGAFLPILSDRINGFAMQFRAGLSVPAPIDYKSDMKRVYFDIAGFPLNKQLRDLLLDVSVENLLYGSDAPYTPDIACIAQTGGLESVSGFSKADKENVFTFNAVRLVPRLKNILNINVQGNSVSYTNKPLTFPERTRRAVRTVISKLYSIVFA